MLSSLTAAVGMPDTAAEIAPSTTWRCPNCRLWVKEPMARKCALCKECAREEAEQHGQE